MWDSECQHCASDITAMQVDEQVNHFQYIFLLKNIISVMIITKLVDIGLNLLSIELDFQ